MRLVEFKQEIEEQLQVKVTIMDTPENVVKNSELLLTTTPSTEPVVKSEWIKPGMHITAMGSDAEHKQELDPEILRNANIYVCDVISQCKVLGELRSALEQNIFTHT